MTNPRSTPEQGAPTEEQIEAVAKAKWERVRRSELVEWAQFDPGLKEIYRSDARADLRAAFSASVSAHPGGEHHDAEEREGRAEGVIAKALVNIEGGDRPEMEDHREDARTVAHDLRAAGLLAPESEDHAATVTGKALRVEDDYSHIYWRDPVEGCWVAYRRADCVGEEELPATRLGVVSVPSSDRDKMLAECDLADAELRKWVNVPAKHLRAALAAPVEADEAKLAEVLDDHSRYVMVQPGVNECGCGVPVGPVQAWNVHKARAVTKWLRAENP